MIHNLPGKLIVFEGIDGTGKSTQLVLLAEYLRRLELPVVTTREPTDGRYGREIRQLYNHRERYSQEEELALFLADRREHTEQFLRPALTRGEIILCDRYFLSTAAYQGAKGGDPLAIIAMNDFAPEPDLVLLLQAPLTVGLTRITAGRGDLLNDFEQATGLAQVAAIFAALRLPYIRTIDADQTIAEVHAAICAVVDEMFTPALCRGTGQ